ncbi:hypothetical protein [Rhodopirellula sallentina]|uniref:Uncharacterized protein n=1 Tax=Rhodopirellula sallentina SM41 TaxID=1263870 RepID=M5U9B0_9BACT|nr:hypothetical protein [Rhodopirellula sallentina]EMI52568.1 hypothetical protein RSSM_06001 [Rhodopirellula sallentina SM41]
MTIFVRRHGLKEIKMLRVTCQKCQVATEFPLEKLAMPRDNMCPHCGDQWLNRNEERDPLFKLQHAIEELDHLNKAIGIEVVFTDQAEG